jgi:cardiolipin synthase
MKSCGHQRNLRAQSPVRNNIPNLLSVSRIAVIPLIVVFATLEIPVCDALACALFAAAAITDYFDGKLARSWGQTSELGRMLDPIADKLLVAACLMVLVAAHTMSAAGLFPAIVIMLREILISGLREYLASVRVGLPVTLLAKWKTGLQMGAIGLLLLGPAGAATIGLSWFPNLIIGEGMLWMAATLTLVTGWSYLRVGIHHATSAAA